MLATISFYALLNGGVVTILLGDGAVEFLHRYCASHLVEYTEVALFMIGMAALILKRLDVAEQLIAVDKPLLGKIPAGGQTADDCDSLLHQLDQLPLRRQRSYLVQRLREALSHVRQKGSAESLDGELKYLAEVDDSRAYGGYALPRIIIWAIPILGFLGTVIGITMAIANLDPKSLETSLSEVVGALAIAFDTTALALALSIVLMFTQFAIDRVENRLFARVEKRVNEELTGRFLESGAGGDPQVAAVRRMSERVIEATEQLVKNQAQLWKTTLEASQRKWAESAGAVQKHIEAALVDSISKSMESWSRQVVEGGQAVAQQNQQHAEQIQQALSVNAQSVAQQNLKHAEIIQNAVTESAEALRTQQQEFHQHGQTLLELVKETGRVVSLEEALNRNLASLSAAHNFEETLASLAAVIHLLNARMTHAIPPAKPADPNAKSVGAPHETTQGAATRRGQRLAVSVSGGAVVYDGSLDRVAGGHHATSAIPERRPPPGTIAADRRRAIAFVGRATSRTGSEFAVRGRAASPARRSPTPPRREAPRAGRVGQPRPLVGNATRQPGRNRAQVGPAGTLGTRGRRVARPACAEQETDSRHGTGDHRGPPKGRGEAHVVRHRALPGTKRHVSQADVH